MAILNNTAAALLLACLFTLAAAGQQDSGYTVYMIPNTHGTIAGWLVNFDTERSYVLNNHLDHLDRIASDKTATLAISEVPNVMALMKFAPQRAAELRTLVAQKRVEFVNGFFGAYCEPLGRGSARADGRSRLALV